jgi:hypothetical protein
MEDITLDEIVASVILIAAVIVFLPSFIEAAAVFLLSL